MAAGCRAEVRWALGTHWPETGAQRAEQAGVKVTAFHTVVIGIGSERPGVWISQGSRRVVGSGPTWVESHPSSTTTSYVS